MKKALRWILYIVGAIVVLTLVSNSEDRTIWAVMAGGGLAWVITKLGNIEDRQKRIEALAAENAYQLRKLSEDVAYLAADAAQNEFRNRGD